MCKATRVKVSFPANWSCFLFDTGVQAPALSTYECIPKNILGVNCQSVVFQKESIDISRAMGIPPETGREVVLFSEFEAEEEGKAYLGAAADWWMEIAVNGKTVCDTLEKGNLGAIFSPEAHPFVFTVKKGRNLMAVRVRSGTGGWCFFLGIPKIMPPSGVNKVDLAQEYGLLKADLHGTNSSPNLHGRGIYDPLPMLQEMNFSIARTHDWALIAPGQRIIDTHFIFPLEDKDPSDPANYYFEPTDISLRLMQEAGFKVFYRLGTSIEHSGDVHINSRPPKDFAHYAEVCAGIVRHYTHGWNKGFHYPITYWEIWNEPNLGGGLCWDGDFDSFVTFFVVVLKRLKSEFPELKIGGPALTNSDVNLFKKLLMACKEAAVCPDFISWHCYSTQPRNAILQPIILKQHLAEWGFPDVELSLNEWHYIKDWHGFRGRGKDYFTAMTSRDDVFGIDSAAFNVATISGWHDTPLDTAFYYGCNIYGALGYFDLFRDFNLNFYSMKIIGELLKNYSSRLFATSGEESVYLLGGVSSDKKSAQLVVTDYQNPRTAVDVEIANASAYEYQVKILDQNHKLEPARYKLSNSTLTLEKHEGGSAVFIVDISLLS